MGVFRQSRVNPIAIPRYATRGPIKNQAPREALNKVHPQPIHAICLLSISIDYIIVDPPDIFVPKLGATNGD